MPIRVRRAEQLDPHRAQDRLNALALYAERMRRPELQALRAIHAEQVVDAQDAYHEALDVLGSELAAFESWASTPVGRSYWPTAQGQAMRGRLAR